MPSEPIETAELLSFTRTVEAQSLSRAAAELGIPRATLGRRLARLEARLGARLLQRTTRRLALTPAGDSFYLRARAILDAVREAEASVQPGDQSPRGVLKVSIPPMPHSAISSLLSRFAEEHPGVTLHVFSSTQHVEIGGSGYDVALRAGIEHSPGLVSRTLLRSRLHAVASPAYLQAHGTPHTLGDLRAHRCLVGFARGELPETHWPLLSGEKIRVQGSFFSNDMQVLSTATQHGLGIALLPVMLSEPLIARGLLVPVLEHLLGAETRVALVYAERSLPSPALKAFLSAASSWPLF